MTLRGTLTAVAMGALVTVTAACDMGVSSAPAAPPERKGALADSVRFYVDPEGHGPQQVRALRAAGKQQQAEQLSAIADRPTATWFSGQHRDPYLSAQRLTRRARGRHQVPVLVVYNLPQRDCGKYSSGGARDVDAYLSWLGSLAAGLGRRPAVVILEPDAIPHTLQGCAGARAADERFRMLTEAVKILKRQPRTTVYVDAGNASWISNLDRLAAALRASGVARADGFALNVANFETTAVSIAYGRKLSDRLDRAHFVIDTSRNGSGPPRAEPGVNHAELWCNPRGRTLGTPPTTRTADPRVDAYLWIKQPGDSDGSCRPGAPPAGTWWSEQALDLTD